MGTTKSKLLKISLSSKPILKLKSKTSTTNSTLPMINSKRENNYSKTLNKLSLILREFAKKRKDTMKTNPQEELMNSQELTLPPESSTTSFKTCLLELDQELTTSLPVKKMVNTSLKKLKKTKTKSTKI